MASAPYRHRYDAAALAQHGCLLPSRPSRGGDKKWLPLLTGLKPGSHGNSGPAAAPLLWSCPPPGAAGPGVSRQEGRHSRAAEAPRRRQRGGALWWAEAAGAPRPSPAGLPRRGPVAAPGGLAPSVAPGLSPFVLQERRALLPGAVRRRPVPREAPGRATSPAAPPACG